MQIHILSVKAFAILISILIIAGGALSVLALLFYYQQQFQPSQVHYSILSESQESNSLPVIFENATNLTNNPVDSVYGQVAAWNSHVYVLWQDSMPSDNRNYDIFIKNSVNNGTTFGLPVNLSNNPGFSEHPQIAVYGNNVYAIWADNTSGNREILFTKSVDNGASFDSVKNLSNNTSDSLNQEIAAFGNNVYVIWLDQDEDGTNISLRASADGGATFGRTVVISSSNANDETFPKIAAYGSNVYIAWNIVDEDLDIDVRDNDGLFFVRSPDGGNTFDNIMKLNHNNNFGEPQIAVVNDTVYVVSGGLHSKEVNGLSLIKSADGGKSFSEPEMIDANGIFVNPLNVEVAASDPQFSYVAGDVAVSGNGEILLLEMNGNNPLRVLNLSNNAKMSECPSVAIAGDNIYVVWEDLTPGNHEILYAKGVRS
jgi:hypothetical protein